MVTGETFVDKGTLRFSWRGRGGHNEQDGSGHCFRCDGQTAHSQQGERPLLKVKMTTISLVLALFLMMLLWFCLKIDITGDTMVQGGRYEHRQSPFQTPLPGRIFLRFEEFGKNWPLLEFPLQNGCNNF